MASKLQAIATRQPWFRALLDESLSEAHSKRAIAIERMICRPCIRPESYCKVCNQDMSKSKSK